MSDLRDQQGNPNPADARVRQPGPAPRRARKPHAPHRCGNRSGSYTSLMTSRHKWSSYWRCSRCRRAAAVGPRGGAGHHAPMDELCRSGSSSSSSSEHDGQGGRRKKGLKQKINEKLGGSKQLEDPTAVGADKHQAAAAKITPGVGVNREHEKKSMMEKIKEKLPGHHHAR